MEDWPRFEDAGNNEDIAADVEGTALCVSAVFGVVEVATAEVSLAAEREVDGVNFAVVVGKVSVVEASGVADEDELDDGDGMTIGVEVFVLSDVEAIAEVLRNRRKLSCLCIT